eukprot:m.232607 g.232607  ORF g.232607 m.232607 type:complete len:56 (+) comp13902_c1_seq7:1258-1425(+)
MNSKAHVYAFDINSELLTRAESIRLTVFVCCCFYFEILKLTLSTFGQSTDNAYNH